MQDSPSDQMSSPQTREDKLAILGRNGYSADRLAGLAGTAPMPDAPYDVVGELTEEARAVGIIDGPEPLIESMLFWGDDDEADADETSQHA